MTLIHFLFSRLRTSKAYPDKCLKSPVSEDAFTSNMGNVPKHCWNMHHRTFIIFSGHWVDKCLKSLVSEDPSRSNMVNVPKHCWNLHHCTFIILIVHWQGNSNRKSLSYWHVKSWDYVLTHWVPMKSTLFLIEKI